MVLAIGMVAAVNLAMCGRALSGVGAALVLPATLAVTLARLEPMDRPRGVAPWSALTGIGRRRSPVPAGPGVLAEHARYQPVGEGG